MIVAAAPLALALLAVAAGVKLNAPVAKAELLFSEPENVSVTEAPSTAALLRAGNGTGVLFVAELGPKLATWLFVPSFKGFIDGRLYATVTVSL